MCTVWQVLEMMAEHKLFLQPEKYKFECTQIEYLGLMISENQVAMDLRWVLFIYYLIIRMIIFEINIVNSISWKPLRYTVLYMFMPRRQKSGDPWPYGPIYVALHIIGHTFREWMRPSFFGLRRITKHSTIKRLGCIGPVRRVFRICRNSVNSTLTQISLLV